MKIRILISFISILSFLSNAGAQTDRHGNPVFNNETISIDTLGAYQLTSAYFTIQRNISNKESSVYVNDHPTLDDYLTFSRDLPSYTFLLHKDMKMLVSVMLIQKNEASKTTLNYLIIPSGGGETVEIPCRVWGEISEKRVEELEEMNVDKKAARIALPNDDNLFLFNKIAYRIQSYEALKAEVNLLIKEIIRVLEK